MASGDVLDRFYPPGDPTSTNYGTFDTRNQHPVIDFDAALDEAVTWEWDVPTNYSGGGIRATLKWSATSATSGNAVIGGAFERIEAGGQDVDADDFAAVQQATAATNGTSGVLTYTDIDFTDGTQINSIVAGDHARFKFSRNGSSGSDTMAGDLELHSIVLKEI